MCCGGDVLCVVAVRHCVLGCDVLFVVGVM